MKKILFVVLGLVLTFVASFAFADVTWEPDVRLTNDPTSSTWWRNRTIATDSQNRVHVVWRNYRGGSSEVYYKRSLDGGETWGSDVRLTDGNNPSIAADSQNRLHVVWEDYRDGNSEIYYKRSLDGGETWGPDLRLTANSEYSSSPRIATDSQNRVHVVWNQRVKDSSPVIHYKRSLDGGQTWENEVQLTGNSIPDEVSIAIATDSKDRVHIVWSHYYRDPYFYYAINYKRSMDGGQTWEDDVQLTTPSNGSLYPSIAADSQNRLHVVWEDWRGGDYAIYYKRYLDKEQIWENEVGLINNSNRPEYPSITTDFQNRVHVVWQDTGYGGIYYKRYLDAEERWEPDVQLTRSGAFPFLATDSQNRIHVVWVDSRDGNEEIYYKRGTQSAKWTVMVYGGADNNLDLRGVEDLNELEYAGSGNDVNMIFLLDRWSVNDTKLYYAFHDPDGLPDGADMNIMSGDISESARSWLVQEEDMGNPQTLQDFTLWTMEKYPADHYLISIWDHGNGIFLEDQDRCNAGIATGMVWDDHGGVPGEYIDLAEFRDVLAALYAANGNKKLSIVGLDACLMGQIETFYQMKNYADYGIASEEKEPGDGWEYGYSFKELVDDPDMPASNLASRIVDFYGQRYQTDPGAQDATLAAVDLGALPGAIPKVNNFSGYLYSFMDPFDSSIRTARANVKVFNKESPDLYHFAQLISQDTNLPLSLRDSANQLMAAYPNFIVNEWHGSQSANAYGLSIWFPEDFTQNPDNNDYLTKIDFSREKWDEFLKIYETPFEVLSLKLTLNTPIVHRGEDLRYTAEVGNSSWVSHDLKTWADLTLPNGNPYPGNPVIGPTDLSLGPRQNLQRNLIYPIPQRTPFGTYMTGGNLSTVDDFLLDQDGFNFQVAPSQGLRFGKYRSED